MAIPTSFYLASFALGALVACLIAFLGGALGLQWLCFVGVSLASLLLLRPYARRLDRETAPMATVGANRWVGKTATVITDIPGGKDATGAVRLEREEWRATSLGHESISAGTEVVVERVDGTRVIVRPVEKPIS